MREIKFRAWFTRDEKYIKPMTIQNMIHQNVSTFSLSVLYNEVVFEQYTGLKDKNGAEIYDGDIVKTFSNINKYTRDFANDVEPQYKNTAIAYENGAFRVTYKGKPDTILNNNGGTLENIWKSLAIFMRTQIY